MTGLYNRDIECLLRGTNWVFKCNSVSLSPHRFLQCQYQYTSPSTCVHLNIALPRNRSTRKMGAFRKSSAPFGHPAALDRKVRGLEL